VTGNLNHICVWHTRGGMLWRLEASVYLRDFRFTQRWLWSLCTSRFLMQLAGFLFDAENGGDTFLLSASGLVLNTWSHNPINSHHCENPEANINDIIIIRVPTANIRNFTMFTCSSSHCPSSRYVSVANAICELTDIFSYSCLNVNSFNRYIFLMCVCLFCLISLAILIRTDSVIGHWLLSSASKWIKNWIESNRIIIRSRDSSVGIETAYAWNQFTARANFLFLHSVQTVSGAQPASYPMGTGRSFPWIQRHEADCSILWTCTSTPSYVFMA
jgi:hypothetical protein